MIFGQSEVGIGQITPGTGLYIVRRTLMVVVGTEILIHHRELVDAARAYRRGRFATQKHVLGQAAIAFFISMGTIVEARHVDHGGKSVVEHTRHLVHAACHGARGVFAMTDVLQMAGQLVTIGAALRGHFVTDAPHHHAGSVAIVVQHIHQVAVAPLRKETVITVVDLAQIPFVERLYHHHETHFVAQFHQLGRRHVVRGTNGIAAHILEQEQLVAQGGTIDGCAQGAQVVMVAHAAEFAPLSVQIEAPLGDDLNGSDAETGGVSVDQAGAVDVNACGGMIKVGMLGRPQHGALDNEVLQHRAIVQHRFHAVFAGHDLSLGRSDFGDHTERLQGAHMEQARLQTYGGKVGSHVRSRNVGTPNRHVDFLSRHHVNVAIQPRARVPSRRLGLVLQAHGEHIVLSVGPDGFGYIAMKGVVAVRPISHLLSVHVDTGIAHRAIEDQAHFLALGHVEATTIPAYAHVGQTAGAAGLQRRLGFLILGDGHVLHVIVSIKRSVDGPVVRNGDALPGPVVIRGLLCPDLFSFNKLPALFEQYFRALGRERTYTKQQKQA